MVLATALAVTLVGLDGTLVEVQADLSPGLPGTTIIGLPDTALAEARDRVRAGVLNAGLRWPGQRLTVALSPAALPKSGSGFDLAIAAAVLAAQGSLPAGSLRGRVLLGELGLDGRARPVPGTLPAALAAARGGARRMVVAAGAAREAGLVAGLRIEPVTDLAELVALLRGMPTRPARRPGPGSGAGRASARALPAAEDRDLGDVVGQPLARLAVEVAAAGGHHLLLHGPPGTGKTMLAERVPGLLPDLDDQQALEVSCLHSLAGLLPADRPLLRRPPLRAPHHSASTAALVGGGTGQQGLRPGQASLAHHGVLFLDEAPEFASSALDALRQPLEAGEVVLGRSGSSARFPARFTLVLAANPCPCGAAGGHPSAGADCRCSAAALRRYAGKLSGPLLDRIDLQVAVTPVTRSDLLRGAAAESSAAVRARVAAARGVAAQRYRATGWLRTAEVPGPQLRARWPLAASTMAPLREQLDRATLSLRGLDRILRVAWTLADLSGCDRPGPEQVELALALRGAPPVVTVTGRATVPARPQGPIVSTMRAR